MPSPLGDTFVKKWQKRGWPELTKNRGRNWITFHRERCQHPVQIQNKLPQLGKIMITQLLYCTLQSVLPGFVISEQTQTSPLHSIWAIVDIINLKQAKTTTTPVTSIQFNKSSKVYLNITSLLECLTFDGFEWYKEAIALMHSFKDSHIISIIQQTTNRKRCVASTANNVKYNI